MQRRALTEEAGHKAAVQAKDVGEASQVGIAHALADGGWGGCVGGSAGVSGWVGAALQGRASGCCRVGHTDTRGRCPGSSRAAWRTWGMSMAPIDSPATRSDANHALTW